MQTNDKNDVNLWRRRFLKNAGALPVAMAAGCATTVPAPELRYAESANIVRSGTGSDVQFDRQEAIENLGVSILPEIYEHRVIVKKEATHEETMQAMRERLPFDAELSLVRHGNTTAAVVYFPARHKLAISFDGTQEIADMMDHAKFWGSKHALGGEVHTGYKEAIELSGGPQHPEKLSERLSAMVAEYAKRDGNLDVTLTGFSRGGSLANVLAAEWFAKGIPGNAHLTDVQTFAAMPYGRGEFIKNYEAAAAQHGTRITQLIAGKDGVPDLARLAPFPYKHAGDSMYLMPNKDTGITDIMINPSTAELEKRKAGLEERGWHELNVFARLFGAQNAAVDYDVKPSPRVVQAKASRIATLTGERER